MRLPWRRREEPSVDPNRRHDYKPKGGVGNATIAIGSAGSIAAPGAVDRTRACAVCGRMRDDVVHAAEDD